MKLTKTIGDLVIDLVIILYCTFILIVSYNNERNIVAHVRQHMEYYNFYKNEVDTLSCILEEFTSKVHQYEIKKKK
jgi:hypothetical protein